MKRSDFAIEVYKKLEAPVNTARINFGVTWAAFENTEATNNPWATTEPFEGSSDFNEAGVKNYATFENGVDATVETLLLPAYEHFVTLLRNPDVSVMELLNALDGSPWGSNPTGQLYEDVVNEFDTFNKEVPGSGGDVVAPPIEPPKEDEPVANVQMPTLKVGDNSRAVLSLTVLLKHYEGATFPNFQEGDVFNDEVDTVVKAYQEKWGLKVDGVVGPQTWSSLFFM